MGMFRFWNVASYSILFLVFLLIATSKSLVSFIWDNCELVNLLFFWRFSTIVNTLSALVYANAKSSANFLTFLFSE